jgi:hypothetical protein
MPRSVNKTQSKWCINKHGSSKIIDMFETYQGPGGWGRSCCRGLTCNGPGPDPAYCCMLRSVTTRSRKPLLLGAQSSRPPLERQSVNESAPCQCGVARRRSAPLFELPRPRTIASLAPGERGEGTNGDQGLPQIVNS